MEAPELRKILQRLVNGDCLPSPSPLLLKVLELAASEQASVAELTQLIARDPAMTTRLLKIANSAFYSHGRSVSSLSQAVLVIGFTKLRTLALSLALRDSFPMGRVGAMDYEFFWKTSLYRAFVAQGVARLEPFARRLSSDEAFTAGLILEIGLLMLHYLCPPELKNIFPGADVPLEEIIAWEQQHLNMNHRQIGRMTLARWSFPEQLLETQKYFGAEALREERSTLCRLLEFSRATAEIFFGSRSDFGFIQETAMRLGFSIDSANEILNGAFAMVESIASELRLHMESAKEVLLVLEKAHRGLIRIGEALHENWGKIREAMGTSPRAGREATTVELHHVLEAALFGMTYDVCDPLEAIHSFATKVASDPKASTQLLSPAGTVLQEAQRLQELARRILSALESQRGRLEPGDTTEPGLPH
jgi:HD-like signal output (HDOD) protein